MIYSIHSEAYASFLTVAPSAKSVSASGGGGHKKAEVKAKGSDGKYQGE